MILPNRKMFRHYLFRLSLNFPNFAENWRKCYEVLQDDPHVLMFFAADSDYQWYMIT